MLDDDRTLVRTTECDIALEAIEGGLRAIPVKGDRGLLPIALHPRNPARHIAVTDARGGEPLPFLTRREERALVAAGLAAWSYELLGDDATLAAIDANARYEYILSRIESGFAMPHREQVDDALLAKLGDELSDLIADFAENRLVVAMPLAAALGTRRPWRDKPGRFRITETHAEDFRRDPVPWWSRRTRFGLRHAEFWAGVSTTAWTLYDRHQVRHCSRGEKHFYPWDRRRKLDDVEATISAGQVGECESFHIELASPPGVYLDYARLIVTRTVNDPDSQFGVRAEVVEVEDDDPHWATAHMYFNDAIAQLSGGAIVDSSVVAVFRPMYHGVMRSGAGVAALSSAMLLFLAFTAGWQAAGWQPRVHLPFDGRDTNSVVSLLLTVPSVALALLIREDEHLFTKYVLQLYRTRLAVVAVATFGAGVSLAVGLSGTWLFGCLLAAGVVAFLLAGSVWISGRYSKRRLRARAPARSVPESSETSDVPAQ